MRVPWRLIIPVLTTTAVAVGLPSACSTSSDAPSRVCGSFPPQHIAVLYECDLVLASSHVAGPCATDGAGNDLLEIAVTDEGTCVIDLVFENNLTASASIGVMARSYPCGSVEGGVAYYEPAVSTVVVGVVSRCDDDAAPSCGCEPADRPDGSVLVVAPGGPFDAGDSADVENET